VGSALSGKKPSERAMSLHCQRLGNCVELEAYPHHVFSSKYCIAIRDNQSTNNAAFVTFMSFHPRIRPRIQGLTQKKHKFVWTCVSTWICKNNIRLLTHDGADAAAHLFQSNVVHVPIVNLHAVESARLRRLQTIDQLSSSL
jgi:hypothetical protein